MSIQHHGDGQITVNGSTEGLTFDGTMFRYQRNGQVTLMTEAEARAALEDLGLPADASAHLCRCERLVHRLNSR